MIQLDGLVSRAMPSRRDLLAGSGVLPEALFIQSVFLHFAVQATQPNTAASRGQTDAAAAVLEFLRKKLFFFFTHPLR